MPRERKVPLKSKNSSVDPLNDGEGNVPTTKSKKRRVSTAASGNNQTSSTSNQSNQSDLAPPMPSSTYGDTIIAANPFDDAPQRSTSQPPTPTALNQPPSNGPPMGPNGQQGPQSGPPQQSPQQQQGQQQQPQHPSQQQQQQQQQQQHHQQQPLPPQQQQSQQAKSVPMMSGKIYPVELPMIFNPANPNAPPIYPCGICHKEVHDNDQAILCESGCNFWFHRACTGLTECAFHLLTAEVYAEWACDKCLQTKKVPLVKFKP